MASLPELRKTLSPKYGNYTDMVISLIGADPHPDALKAAKRGDLAEAHAASLFHFCGWFSRKQVEFVLRSKHAKRFSSALIWPKDAPAVPTWFSRQLKQIPAKLPKIRANAHEHHSGAEAVDFNCDGSMIGNARVWVIKRGYTRVMVVGYLQQQTRSLTSRQAREMEGWKNRAMQLLERLAKQRRCAHIFYSTGAWHSEHSIGAKPIHVELLETYGRLPMQHGFELRRIAPAVKFGGINAMPSGSLWWVKDLYYR